MGCPTGSLARPEEFHKCEPYCLYVRVLRDSDVILEQDQKVPGDCWNASISKDICEARTGVLPGTFSIDLLSDTEFLVYKLPKTGWGMTRDEATLFINLIRGGYFWAGVPAKVFATSRTMPQTRRDKMKTCDYRCSATWFGERTGSGSGANFAVVSTRTWLPDDYHSAREPSEFEYDSKETNEPKEDGDRDEEDDRDDTSICSDVTSRSSGHDTD